MIEIRNLTKIFKPKSKDKTVALDNVNISFPNKGLVFVVGKSGSGKTTLLSLIGGLDNVSEGQIFVNDEEITKFSHRKLDQYRNNTVGYIFQDYQLIENLTIYENLKMMLDFKNEKDDSKIKEALKEVDLEGYENRLPKELSGGQKQRISIARILVKNPSIILADEPTGNLDVKNTKQILSLLKNIAKDKLVLVVSHDIFSANEFADYMIYLKHGEIISKYKKTENLDNKLSIKNNVLYVPIHENIDFENKKEIIDQFNDNEIKDIIQTRNSFEECEFKFEKEQLPCKKTKHLSFKNSFKYGFKFYRGQVVKSLVFSLFASILLSFISLFVSINAVEEQSQLAQNLLHNTPKELALVKKDNNEFGGINISLFADEIDPSYKDIFKKAGYTGKIYEAPNVSNDTILANAYLKGGSVKLNKYIKGDENYYKKLFGKNDELVFLSKNETQYEDGIYVSDVFAYKFAHRHEIETEKTFYNITESWNYLINGIIKTDCEERFPNIYENYVKQYNKEKLEALKDTPEYNIFPTMYESFYCCGYGLSDTCFLTNFNNEFSNFSDITKNIFKVNGNTYSLPNLMITPNYDYKLPDINEDEIALPLATYNLISDKYINPSPKPFIKVDPIEIDFSTYDKFDDKLENPKFNRKLKVVGVLTTGSKFLVNQKVKEEIVEKYDTISALYFDDTTQIKSIIKGIEELDLMPISYSLYANRLGNRYLRTLNEFFIFLMSVLIIVVAIGLIFYNLKVIHNRYFEIGIMKSLGCKDSSLMTMFSINIGLTYLKTALMFNIFNYFLVKVVNKILVISINKVTTAGIKFLNNNITIYLQSNFVILINLIIFLAFIIVYLIPFLKIRFLKPTNIVKAKE